MKTDRKHDANNSPDRFPPMGQPSRGHPTDGRSVLVVDDDEVLRLLLATALQTVGFKVQRAENGKEGYDLFVKNRCDLVVTDLQMPVLDGFGLVNKIKKRSPDTPIILITGEYLDDWSPIGGREKLATVLLKPFKMDVLRRAALNALHARRNRKPFAAFTRPWPTAPI